MPLELMIALIIVLPIIILLAIFVWYLNFGRIYATVRETPRKEHALADGKKLQTGQV
jgi:Tfp pilus assembly protein PilW